MAVKGDLKRKDIQNIVDGLKDGKMAQFRVIRPSDDTWISAKIVKMDKTGKYNLSLYSDGEELINEKLTRDEVKENLTCCSRVKLIAYT